MAVKLGKLADELYALREKKGQLYAQIRALEEEETALENKLLTEMEGHGLDQIRGDSATISISRSVVPQVQDWDALYKYVLRHKAVHLLQRRLAIAAYREALELNKGKPLPGVIDFEKTTLNVRKV